MKPKGASPHAGKTVGDSTPFDPKFWRENFGRRRGAKPPDFLVKQQRGSEIGSTLHAIDITQYGV